MKIKLITTPNKHKVPFNYQPSLVGAFHKWLGRNEMHDGISLYSLSWLKGGQMFRDGLDFRNGAEWMISAHDINIIKRIIEGIRDDSTLHFGMMVTDVILLDDPEFPSLNTFFLDSPIFIKLKENEKIKHIIYSDTQSDELMTATLKHKLDIAGLDNSNVTVRFDRDYPHPKTKLVRYKDIDCKASICPVIIEGSQEQLSFAWNVGIGNSTGIGFGALK